MTQTTEASAPPAAVPSIPIQPRDTFTCPSWCTETHTEADIYPWEYGQWTVRHEGRAHTWFTARGTEMEAHLEWVEIVGSSAILVNDAAYDSSGPLIELGGDDGSGFMGTNQISACDVPEWARALGAIAAESEPPTDHETIGLHEVRLGDHLEVTQQGVAKRFYVANVNGNELYTPEDGTVTIVPEFDEIWRLEATA